MESVIECLVTFPQNSSFCDSIEGSNKFLEADSAIRLEDKNIQYKSFTFVYQAIQGDTNTDHRYFQLRFTLISEKSISEKAIEAFTAFLRTIKQLVERAQGYVYVLKNDTTLHYAQQAYASLHEIENLMRRLIANFLLLKVGQNWESESTPGEMKEFLNANKKKARSSFLHSIDFIDLTRFLLNPYSKSTSQDIADKLKAAKTLEEFEAVKALVPRSNWERYFSGIVTCQDAWLKKRWEDLYELRCLVAHNADFGKSDLVRCNDLIGEIKPKLEEALSKLSEVSVPEADRELVSLKAEEEAEQTNPYEEALRSLGVRPYMLNPRRLPDAYEAGSSPYNIINDIILGDSALKSKISHDMMNSPASEAAKRYRDMMKLSSPAAKSIHDMMNGPSSLKANTLGQVRYSPADIFIRQVAEDQRKRLARLTQDAVLGIQSHNEAEASTKIEQTPQPSEDNSDK